ncbi:FRG domain-containing protein [Virgibacillus ainsalahensis]
MITIKEVRVKKFEELHKALSKYRKTNLWLFRGHSNPEWVLVPKAGRNPYYKYDDAEIFQSWKRQAAHFLNGAYGEWDMLTVAQHHGLATRLLDWTFNPLVAAFFAVQSYEECDAVLYAYLNQCSLKTEEIKPFEHEGVSKIKPNGAAPRVVRQSGIFTIHNPPTLRLENNLKEENKLEKIIIDHSYRKELRFELSHYGINELSLFPDLDGLSDHVNWIMENSSYWTGEIDKEVESITE